METRIESPSAARGEADYDFNALAKLRVGAPAGVAEYIGPVVVTPIEGKGRGLVTTREVAAGDLLFVNAAFAVADRTKLIDAAIRRLECCPQPEHDAFFLLGDGTETPTALPLLHVPRLPKVKVAGRVVDRRKVQAILSDNAHDLDSSDLCSGRDGRNTEKRFSGLFFVGSLLNHSCRPTATRVFFGDTMFVRAARSLCKGDEVTDGYFSVLQPCFQRRKLLGGRHFAINDDRAIVEDALLPRSVTEPILEQCDRSESLDDFSQLASRVEQLVWSSLTGLGDGAASSQVIAAASRLSPGLDRMLCGGLMEVFLAVALIASKLRKHGESARAYCRCCSFMEENAPHNGYHVNWAIAALEEAKLAGYPLERYVQYARKVFRVHYGPAALECMLANSSKVTRADISSSPGELNVPPGELDYALSRGADASVHVTVYTRDARMEDVQVLASPRVLQIIVREQRASIVLPSLVQMGVEAVARLSRRQRKLMLSFPSVDD